MGSEVFIMAIIFGVIFGIFYLYISARNRERLALIEKGADANIFYSNIKNGVPVWKVIVINLGMLLIGIGIGIFLANLFSYTFGMDEDVAYTGTIFVMAGVGLLAGFFVAKRLGNEA